MTGSEWVELGLNPDFLAPALESSLHFTPMTWIVLGHCVPAAQKGEQTALLRYRILLSADHCALWC